MTSTIVARVLATAAVVYRKGNYDETVKHVREVLTRKQFAEELGTAATQVKDYFRVSLDAVSSLWKSVGFYAPAEVSLPGELPAEDQPFRLENIKLHPVYRTSLEHAARKFLCN